MRCLALCVVTGGGDEGARGVFLFLMRQACVPFLAQLERWVYHGEVDDPYGEFMVAERSDEGGAHRVSSATFAAAP